MPELNGAVNGHNEETEALANGNGIAGEPATTVTSASKATKPDPVNGHSGDKSHSPPPSNGDSAAVVVAKSADKEAADGEDEDSAAREREFHYAVTFLPPSGESFSMPVSSQELVQEIHQILTDREDCCHRTCFSLSLAGKQLDNFVELKNVPDLVEGCSIRIVEEMYNVKEAKSHLRHIQDILRSTEPIDAYLGREQMSLSFVNAVTQNSLLSPPPPPLSLAS